MSLKTAVLKEKILSMNIVIYENLQNTCNCKTNPGQIYFNHLTKQLKTQGIHVSRYDVTEENADQMKTIDMNSLPITFINDEIVKTGAYPSEDDFNKWLNHNHPSFYLKNSKKIRRAIILACVLSLIFIPFLIIGVVGGLDSIRSVFHFVSRQIMGMRWLNDLVGIIFTQALGSDFMATRWGDALQFFVYDTIKIIVLLCVLIFSISYIQSFFPPERTKKILGKYKGLGANAIGAMLGVLTPFCSCSSIPIFIGFASAGISSGVTFSFLIASPLIDLGALILLGSTFGFAIAAAYIVVGLLLAIIGGAIIEKTGVGRHVRDFGEISQINDVEDNKITQKDRLLIAKDGMLTTLKKVWVYIIIGVSIGATIHNFIPEVWIQTILGADKWYSVLVATFAGTPMYADIFGTIPVAHALFAKGVGVGTIIAFMMSVTVLSVPSMVMLSKAIKPKLFVTFVGVVVLGIIMIGYMFNAFNFLFI
ncbi:MAG: arsenic metallochaperone ArsD family protein [Acholeplasmataceae bacterium]|nr:arsenic metallochaperone ArsD family protein [Acholeplasmataceae bacterium]